MSLLVALLYRAIPARRPGPGMYGAMGLGTALGALFAVLLALGFKSNVVVMTFQPFLAWAWTVSHARCSEDLSLGIEVALSLTLSDASLSDSVTSIICWARFPDARPLLTFRVLTLLFIAIQFTSYIALFAAGRSGGRR